MRCLSTATSHCRIHKLFMLIRSAAAKSAIIFAVPGQTLADTSKRKKPGKNTIWPVVLAGNCPEPKTNSFRRAIYISVSTRSKGSQAKSPKKNFQAKCIFGGPNLENYAKKRLFVCFLTVKLFCQIPHQKFSVLSFFYPMHCPKICGK